MQNRNSFVKLAYCVVLFLSIAASKTFGEVQNNSTSAHKQKLDFRAMCTILGNGSHPRSDGRCAFDFRDKIEARKHLKKWSEEGYNAVVLWVPDSELMGGKHFLLHINEYPEARELSDSEIEKNIKQMRWILRESKELGMSTYMYTITISTTDAFTNAHGLNKEMPVSETVHTTHNHIHRMGVRNELTRAYTESMFAEMVKTYPQLDGFYSPLGESLPGKRSTWFVEAIAPGLRRSGRDVRIIVHHWQVPLTDYITDVASKKAYDNIWCALHAWNSEQITDAQPYPFVLEWAKSTGLPTVSALSPANITNFPFNSPRFAYEIVEEMRAVPNFHGFAYMEWSGNRLSPLFRKALAYYAKSGEGYSEEPWIRLLEAQFGDRKAAEHFLKAYNISAKIIPETCALVWCGHNNYPYRRELRIPYNFLTGNWQPFSWSTSRVRGQPLVPVWHYAYWVAKSPNQYQNKNGADYNRSSEGAYDNYRQIAIWRTEGGSAYDIIPPVHMKKIKKMGNLSLEEAIKGSNAAKKSKTEAEQVVKFMKAYQLLATYYEKKVAAATAALVYKHSGRMEDRENANELATEALSKFITAAEYMEQNLTPIMLELYSRPIQELSGPSIPELIQQERDEREELAEIFNWPVD